MMLFTLQHNEPDFFRKCDFNCVVYKMHLQEFNLLICVTVLGGQQDRLKAFPKNSQLVHVEGRHADLSFSRYQGQENRLKPACQHQLMGNRFMKPQNSDFSSVAKNAVINQLCPPWARGREAYIPHLYLLLFSHRVVSDSSQPHGLQHAACSSLSLTISQSLPKFITIESVMPSNHLILCCPLLLLSSVLGSIKVFSNESVFSITWSKYWSFSIHHQSFQRIFRVDFLQD